MAIDLLLQMDEDLMAHVIHQADTRCMTVEEWLRETLLAGVGLPYERPPARYDAVMRPMVALDLRM